MAWFGEERHVVGHRNEVAGVPFCRATHLRPAGSRREQAHAFLTLHVAIGGTDFSMQDVASTQIHPS
jgi:hypothetical protein